MASSASTSLLSIAACNSQPQSLLTLPSSNLVYAGHGSLFHVPLNRGNPSPFSIPAPSNSPKISCLCSIKATDNTATNSFFAAHADGAITLFLSLSSPLQPYTPADHTVTCAASLQTTHSTILACGTTDPDGSGVSIYTADPSSPPLTLNPPNTSLIVEALDIFVQSSTIVLVAGCALARSNRIFVFAAPLDSPTPSFTAVGSLSGHQDWVRCFSSTTALANGNVLLASGSHDHKIRLWNFQTSKEKVDSVGAVDEDEVDVDALLEDQARLCFTVGVDNIKVTLEALLIGHEESVTSLSFNPSPSLSTQPTLLSSSMDRTLLVWQMTDSGVWMPVARVGSAGGIVGGSVGNSLLGFTCAKWGGGNGDQIVAQGYGGSVHIWSTDMALNPPLFTPLPCITGHFAPTTDLSWEPTRGTYLLTASKDQTVRLWANTEQGWRELGRPQVHGYDMTSLCCVGGGRARGGEVLHRFVSGADEKILRVFDAPGATIKLLTKVTNYQRRVRQGAVDEDDKDRPAERAFLPSLGLSNKGGDGTGEEKGNEEMDDAGTDGNSFGLPSERDLGVETLWPETRKLYGHDTELLCVASTAQSLMRDPNKKIVVASSCKSRDTKNAGIKLWNIENNVCIKTLEDGHKSSVACLAFSSTGTILASSGKDRRLCLWSIDPEVENENNQSALKMALDSAHKRIVWSLSFCQDSGEGSSILISGSRDMTAKVWRVSQDVKSVENLHSIKFTESVTALSFSYPSDFGTGIFAVGLESGSLKIIKLAEDYSSHEIALDVENGHVATVKKLAWRPMDGGELTLASCGLDHAVKIFNITL